MAAGSSVEWPEILQNLTGNREINAKAMLEYFQPLFDFLVKKNHEFGAKIGWEKASFKFNNDPIKKRTTKDNKCK